MGGLSPLHLILILGIALIVIGPGRLPETGAALGKAIRSFRDAVDGATDGTTDPNAAQPTPPPAAPVVPPASAGQPVPPAAGPDETTPSA